MATSNDLDLILKIGKVTSVKGRHIEISVDKSKNAPHLLFNGKIIKNVSVGGYIKICKGFEDLIGKIDGEYISEDKAYSQKGYGHEKDKIRRVLNVSLLGYFEKSLFRQGIKELPLIDNECFLLTQEEFDDVHNFIKTINGKRDEPIQIGSLANEKGKKIQIGVNSLFASHIGIFGNTGSGKSYTLAGLYHRLFSNFQGNSGFVNNARFLFIDFNGEYANQDIKEGESDDIITEMKFKTVYHLSTGEAGSKTKLIIDTKNMYNASFWSILLQATEKTQSPFIVSSFNSTYVLSKVSSSEGILDLIKSTLKLITTHITVNQEKNMAESFLDELGKFDCNKVITGLDNLKRFFSENVNFYGGKDDRRYYCRYEGVTYNSNANDGFYENIISKRVDQYIAISDRYTLNDLQKIKLIINFHFFYSIQKGHYIKEHIGPLIGRLDARLKDLSKLLEVSDKDILEKPLTIISLRDVNVQMRKVIPLIVCNQVYENKKKEGSLKKYLNIVIDEAHNILSYDSERENETWKDYRLETFEEIIKEGRKFGVFLTIASQRPSDISPTIISQLHNYFLHRLINNRDIEAVEKTVSYLDKVSFDSLPILPTGTCILAGLSAQVPVVIEVDEIPKEFEPKNKTIQPTDTWSQK